LATACESWLSILVQIGSIEVNVAEQKENVVAQNESRHARTESVSTLSLPLDMTRDDTLEVIKFWCWVDSRCGSRITFHFLMHYDIGHFMIVSILWYLVARNRWTFADADHRFLSLQTQLYYCLGPCEHLIHRQMWTSYRWLTRWCRLQCSSSVLQWEWWRTALSFISRRLDTEYHRQPWRWSCSVLFQLYTVWLVTLKTWASLTGNRSSYRQHRQYIILTNHLYLYWSVLKIMDAGYCLYVHIFMKNIISLKPINFYNSNQLMPDLRFQQSRRDNWIQYHTFSSAYQDSS